MIEHVNRRTILLIYKCTSCASTQFNYYNPCSLLLHVRRHFSPKGGRIDLDNLHVNLLPLALVGFFPEPGIPTIYHEEDNELGMSNFLNSKFYYPSGDTKGKKVRYFIPSKWFCLFGIKKFISIEKVCFFLNKCGKEFTIYMNLILKHTKVTQL